MKVCQLRLLHKYIKPKNTGTPKKYIRLERRLAELWRPFKREFVFFCLNLIFLIKIPTHRKKNVFSKMLNIFLDDEKKEMRKQYFFRALNQFE